jgi:hypothetical protein
MQRDAAEDFSYPVTDDVAPGYSKQIPQPMDLSTVLSNVEDGTYAAPHEAWADIQLVRPAIVSHGFG